MEEYHVFALFFNATHADRISNTDHTGLAGPLAWPSTVFTKEPTLGYFTFSLSMVSEKTHKVCVMQNNMAFRSLMRWNDFDFLEKKANLVGVQFQWFSGNETLFSVPTKLPVTNPLRGARGYAFLAWSILVCQERESILTRQHSLGSKARWRYRPWYFFSLGFITHRLNHLSK